MPNLRVGNDELSEDKNKYETIAAYYSEVFTRYNGIQLIIQA